MEDKLAKKPNGITIEIGGNTTKLNVALDSATKKADLLIEKLEKAIKLAKQINEEV